MLQSLTYPPKGNNICLNELSKRYKHVCLLDSNKHSNPHAHYAQLLAVGASQELVLKTGTNALEQLQSFYNARKSWMFGYISYDLKNEIEALHSENADGLAFPLIRFFVPEFVFEITEQQVRVHYDDEVTTKEKADELFRLAFSSAEATNATAPVTNLTSRISKNQYITAVNSLKQHILRGDIYEVNFCQEFYSKNAFIDPISVFKKLNSISEAPFAAFCKLGDHYIVSSSPERFLKKEENKLISQPIKGTTRRSADATEDARLKEELRNNLKEQNENVMIVDLVRNDLSQIAAKGSVQVDELFGVYSFKQVHQLISTVSCELKTGISFTDILKAAFPMGSMTGAPKVSAMKLIEEHESTKRGVYSGALGYIDPQDNFDFSVVIRSILYNSESKFLSFMAGSAITAKAEAEYEYEECLLKAKAMFEVLK